MLWFYYWVSKKGDPRLKGQCSPHIRTIVLASKLFNGGLAETNLKIYLTVIGKFT